MLVNATNMLQAAQRGHYALGAFNTNNLEWAASILDAAEQLQSPVIIQCTSGAAKWQVSFKVVADLVRDLVEAKNITVPVALHLDHGSYEDVFKCIDAGFTSVMYDGSHEADFKTNLERTAEVVRVAHAKGISVEAEVGGIGGTEDGVTAKGELADPEQCAQIAELGVDFLACGIGNIHGIYPDNWEGLSFDRLEAIKEKTGSLPLVLHGHPRRANKKGHQPGHLQDQRQHRPAARVCRGSARLHRAGQGQGRQGVRPAQAAQARSRGHGRAHQGAHGPLRLRWQGLGGDAKNLRIDYKSSRD